ncbi:MAG: hypothetical protein J5686_01985 [Bacteroidales bacterium]|nr:hypothetical protein [Bacteroidales bacterium]
MKKLVFALILMFVGLAAYSQDDEYQKYLESQRKQYQQSVNAYQKDMQQMGQDMQDYIDKQNAEFADFMAKQWELFNEFAKDQVEMNKPKPTKVPVATVNNDEKQFSSKEIQYTKEVELPKVTHATAVTIEKEDNNKYEQRVSVDEKGVKNVPMSDMERSKKLAIDNSNNLLLNFYGRQVNLHFDPKLRIKSSGIDEKNVSEYFKKMAKCQNETKALWGEVKGVVDQFGLNEWGYFCLLRTLSEKVFSNVNDRVMFCFYMLRNEGGFKTRIGRGKDSGNLTLLIALDNSKQVYSYTFFRFDDDNKGNKVKYYCVYGGGKANEAVYSYSFSEQDAAKRQMTLDFTKNLNMGECNVNRELKLTKDKTITLPYNKSHIAYLDDVPMTVFPIYFTTALPIESQKVLLNTFDQMKKDYTPTQFISMLLHFVQTGFEYKTDEEQFGYEKYFYPEEVIGYPYCDCEDRSALFAWLVERYTNAKVIGLQYEGHMATAVYFGDNADVKGDGFMYGGKKYFVCDPTYINASIGMCMPQYKGKTPKVIKLKK